MPLWLLIPVAFFAGIGLLSVFILFDALLLSLITAHRADERELEEFRAELAQASEEAIARGLGEPLDSRWSHSDAEAFKRWCAERGARQ